MWYIYIWIPWEEWKFHEHEARYIYGCKEWHKNNFKTSLEYMQSLRTLFYRALSPRCARIFTFLREV